MKFVDPKGPNVPECKCPSCGVVHNCASGIGEDADDTPTPKENDVTVCIRCGALNQFDKDLMLKSVEVDKELEFLLDPRLGPALNAAKNAAAYVQKKYYSR